MTERVKRRRGYTRVSTKHQVTLPASALAEAGIRPGEELRVDVVGNGQLRLVAEKDPVEEFAGSVPGLSEAVDLDRLRSEWRS